MRRIEAIDNRLRELEAEKAKLVTYADMGGFKNGTVLKFKYQFSEGGKKYTYVALKVAGAWFITGQANKSYLNDEDFISWLADAGAIKGLKVATEWQGL